MTHEYTERPRAINVYTCQKCGRGTVTINKDEGVTPFTISCFHCGHPEAYSCMYQCCQSLKPHFEWYRPTDNEIRDVSQQQWEDLQKDKETSFRCTLEAVVAMNKQHAEQGGMFKRPADLGSWATE
jgi:hypothetical protein